MNLENTDLARAIDDMGLALGLLPDPDPILRKIGESTRVFDMVRCDPDVESCIEDRQSRTLLRRFEWVAGGPGADAQRLRDRIAAQLTPERMYSEIESMLEAPYYGCIPVENVWDTVDGLSLITSFRTLPTHSIRFDDKRRPVLRKRFFDTTPPILPEKMTLVRKNHTWENPYGRKLLSVLFWPVTFRRGGLKFWFEFMDRFGLPHMSITLPQHMYETKRAEIAAEAAQWIRDAVAVFQEGMDVNLSDVSVSGSSDMYDRFQTAIGMQISRVITGQSLTRDTGRVGSYAQARTHEGTGDRRAQMDEMMVEQAINSAVGHIPPVNGTDTPAPIFRYIRPPDLQAERAARDARLSGMGTRFSVDYITRAYGFEEGDIVDVTDPQTQSEFARHSHPHQDEVDDFVVEQMVEGGRIADTQARRIIRALKDEASPAAIEDILGEIAGDDPGRYADMMGEVLVAAQMYGRESLADEVGA